MNHDACGLEAARRCGPTELETRRRSSLQYDWVSWGPHLKLDACSSDLGGIIDHIDHPMDDLGTTPQLLNYGLSIRQLQKAVIEQARDGPESHRRPGRTRGGSEVFITQGPRPCRAASGGPRAQARSTGLVLTRYSCGLNKMGQEMHILLGLWADLVSQILPHLVPLALGIIGWDCDVTSRVGMRGMSSASGDIIALRPEKEVPFSKFSVQAPERKRNKADHGLGRQRGATGLPAAGAVNQHGGCTSYEYAKTSTVIKHSDLKLLQNCLAVEVASSVTPVK
ncbi:hypothetical protein EI94DRAFT_1789157 [Lactarius quietus]|nr:hypothetical protein EI94DRAFT_1789157 [Lactarius quietus]